MEFKGTKGKWINSSNAVHDEKGKCVCITYENRRANALLISKAPEMLEMLQRIENILTYDTIEPNSPLQEEIYNLIKKATEL